MTKKRIASLMMLGGVVLLASCEGFDYGYDQDSTEVPKETIVVKEKPEVGPNGVGPIKKLELSAFDADLAKKGEETFKINCIACHNMEHRVVGPKLGGILDRRNPAWVMNMILNPDVMVIEDPVAKDLLAEYLVPMVNQKLSEEQARGIVEYFRSFNQ